MTTIRKIVTSKIDGDNANNTSTNEVRPFGEMAVYIDNENNGGLDKLELLMFDGARTHLRSKVLAKGTFYGGDADSGSQGDGIENFDTIKLIPDAELHYNDGDYDNDQYIVIDPTLPNHIHVRAGGAIDSSTATLFLGGEENNVMVSDSADQVAISTNSTHTWLFGTDGKLTVPANSSILTNETALKIATHPTTTYTFNRAYWEAVDEDITRVVTPTGNAQYFACTVTANQDGTYTVGGLEGNSFAPGNWFKVPGNELGGVTPANDIQITVATVDVDGVILTTTITGTAVGKQWQFGTSGNLTLPGTLTLPAGGTITEGAGPFTGAIKLTPAGGANAYQALMIYPTAAAPDGDHIHLAAPFGGTTELYLGSDLHYVKLANNGNVEVQASTGVLSGTAAWTFDTDGNIDARQALGIKVPNGVPSSITDIGMTTGSWELNPMSNLATTGGSGTGLTVNITETDGYATAIAIATAGTGYLDGELITVTSGTSQASFLIAVTGTRSWTYGIDGKLTVPGNLQVDGGKIILNTGDNAYVESVDYGVNSANSAVNIFGGPYQKIKLRAGFGTQATWTFGTDGSLTFPDATVQSTAYTGSTTVSSLVNGANTLSLGSTGSLTLPTAGKIVNGTISAIGDTRIIATNSSGGVTPTNPEFAEVAYSATILSTYSAGDTITLNNGNVRTITSVASGGGGGYITISWSGPSNSNPAFPLTLTTSDYEAERPNEWTFGTNSTLTFPNNTVQSTAWAGIPGPYADDAAAATAGVAVGYPYHKTGTGGQVFVRLT